MGEKLNLRELWKLEIVISSLRNRQLVIQTMVVYISNSIYHAGRRAGGDHRSEESMIYSTEVI